MSGEDDSSFVPLYIPEDTVPVEDEGHVLYFKVEIDSNHLASVGGILSYTLISDPADTSGDRPAIIPGPEVILEGRELAPSSGRSLKLY